MLNSIFDINRFSTAANLLQLNGRAVLTGDTLQLTPNGTNQAGSAFYSSSIVLDANTSFSSRFQFRIGGGQGTNGADGFTFMLHNGAAGNRAIGNVGGNLGYAGIAGNSVAIEFDTYQNTGDPNNNHIAINRNGNVSSSIATASLPFDLNSNRTINAWIDYNGNTDKLDIFLSESTTKPTAVNLSTTIDLFSALGNRAFVGFSGGTGGAWNAHDILNWQLSASTPAPPPPPIDNPINGNGNGLKAEYFDNSDLTNLKLTRTDSTINFNWGSQSPDSSIAPDTFSARWTGQIMPRYTDTYTFHVSGDDGVRLWVNGQQIVNGWRPQSPTTYRGTVSLLAGVRYDIRLEYYESTGGAVATLGWSSPKQAYEIVPQAQLFSNSITPPPPPPPPAPAPKFNYAEALQKSIYFYDAQRSGDLSDSFRVEWRGDSALRDGADVGRDLVGGWFDAGDGMKFSRTIGYTAAMLSWSWLETPQAFSNTGQTALFLDSLKWGVDYLLKAFTNDNPGQYEFYSQVGSMGSGPRDDHSNWVVAEVLDQVTDRPSYKITTATPSSDIAGHGAAGLASASIVFRNAGNLAYADLLLSKAEKLFNFANNHRGMGREVAPNGTVVNQAPYTDVSFMDELLWSATWVHKAKLAGNANYGNQYLTIAESIFNESAAQVLRGNAENQQSWQWVDHGAEILLAELTNKAVYRQEVENTLDWWTIGHNNSRVNYTPGGLAWRYEWGALRYATTQSFMALVYNETISDSVKQNRYRSFAEKQVHYTLGENPLQRSYMLGFGNNPIRTPHHRTAYGPWAGWDNFNKTSPLHQALPRHTLFGAIVGGPNLQDQFTEDVTNYMTNEVAIDYNAGLTGALAKLVQSYGGNPVPNFPAPEQRDDQFFVEASLLSTGSNFTEIRTLLNNRSAWPARVTDKLAFRYYISLESGVSLSDLSVTRTGGTGNVSLKAYRDNIVYVEVDLSGTKIFPGGYVNGQWTFQKETTFRVSSTKAWDIANDWSFNGLATGTLTKRTRFAVYDNGVKVYGLEP